MNAFRFRRTASLLGASFIFLVGCAPEGVGAFLGNWERHEGPILRDFEADENYEIAADPHPFRTQDGALAMLYTGPHPDSAFANIKLARADNHTDWTAGTSVLLEGSNSDNLDRHKETAFYRRADSGKHQIYYIGYDDEAVYQSQIFMAEAENLEGPYALPSAPIIPTGKQNGHDVATQTSPSIVAHGGRLYMVYCAWNSFPEPTAVWVHGATSDDDGATWNVVGEVPVPVCMEGALTAGPDGYFYAVAQTDEGFSIAQAEDPFGPYDTIYETALTLAGAPWEKDEMNTPHLLFEGETAYLYYTGADYSKGWWTLLATTSIIE